MSSIEQPNETELAAAEAKLLEILQKYHGEPCDETTRVALVNDLFSLNQRSDFSVTYTNEDFAIRPQTPHGDKLLRRLTGKE